MGFVPSREDVARRVSPEDTELARAAASLFRGGRPVSVIRSSKRRRRTEDTLYRFATTRHRSGSAEIMTAPLLVHSAKALHDRRIREPLLWRLARWLEPADEARRRHAVDGLCLMTRSCPPPLIAPVASCTAAVAWQVGDGALARLAAERGLAESPDNVLCRLVLDAVSAGIPPKVWVEMLANFSVASLRNPPSDRR